MARTKAALMKDTLGDSALANVEYVSARCAKPRHTAPVWWGGVRVEEAYWTAVQGASLERPAYLS